MLDCASPFRTDLAPVTFWLFPNLQPNLKGKRSQDFEEIKIGVAVTLKVIPNDEFVYLRDCAHNWAELDSRSTASSGIRNFCR